MNRAEAVELLTGLIRQIAAEADLSALDPDAPLQEGLDLDSMDFLNLVSAVHDRTGIDIPERDYPQLATLASFASYIAARAG